MKIDLWHVIPSRIALGIIVVLGLAARPVWAGFGDWFHLGSSHESLEPAVAQKRVGEYLRGVLGIKNWRVSNGRNDLTSRERRNLDSHVLSRLDRTQALAVVDVKTAGGVSGIGMLAAAKLDSGAFDPSAGYIAYISLLTDKVFPADADRALSLMTNVVPESSLFGFSPEGGPIWKVTDKYLGKLPGDPTAQFSGADSAADDAIIPAYQVHPNERSPDSDEIPAWVIRGTTDFIWRGSKPLELGVLVTLDRRPGTTKCRLTHVTSIGDRGKQLFAGGIRASAKDKEEE
jgi:hypothetical protein